MKKYFLQLDIYGKPFTFQTSGAYKYKSIFGAFVSIFTIIFAVFITAFFRKTILYQKLTYSCFTNDVEAENYTIFNVTNENFQMYFGLDYRNGKEMLEMNEIKLELSFYQMEYSQTKQAWVSQAIIRSLAKRCNQVRNHRKMNKPKHLDLSKFYCIDFDEYAELLGLTSLPLGGYWDRNFINRISVNLCNFYYKGIIVETPSSPNDLSTPKF